MLLRLGYFFLIAIISADQLDNILTIQCLTEETKGPCILNEDDRFRQNISSLSPQLILDFSQLDTQVIEAIKTRGFKTLEERYLYNIPDGILISVPVYYLSMLNGEVLSSLILHKQKNEAIFKHLIKAILLSNDTYIFSNMLQNYDFSYENHYWISDVIMFSEIPKAKTFFEKIPLLFYSPPQSILERGQREFFFLNLGNVPNNFNSESYDKTNLRFWAYNVIKNEFPDPLSNWYQSHLNRWGYLLTGATNEELSKLRRGNTNIFPELSHFEFSSVQVRFLFDKFGYNRSLAISDCYSISNALFKLLPSQLAYYPLGVDSCFQSAKLPKQHNYPASYQIMQYLITQKLWEQNEEKAAQKIPLNKLMYSLPLTYFIQYIKEPLNKSDIFHIQSNLLSKSQLYYLSVDSGIFDFESEDIFNCTELVRVLPARDIINSQPASHMLLHLLSQIDAFNVPQTFALLNKLWTEIGSSSVLKELIRNSNAKLVLEYIPSRFIQQHEGIFSKLLDKVGSKNLPNDFVVSLANKLKTIDSNFQFHKINMSIFFSFDSLTCEDISTLDPYYFTIVMSNFNRNRKFSGKTFPKELQYCCISKLSELLHLKYILHKGFIGNDELSLLNEAEINAIGGYVLSALPPTAISKSKHKRLIIKLIGKLSHNELLTACPFNHLKKLSSILLKDFGHSEKISTPLFDMGNLTLYMESNYIEKIDEEYFKLFLESSYIDHRVCADKSTLNAWYRLIRKSFGEPSKWSYQTLFTLGDFLLAVPTVELGKIKEINWIYIADLLDTKYNDKIRGNDKFYEVCLVNLSSKEKTLYENKLKDLIKIFVESAQMQLNTVVSSRDLVKRQQKLTKKTVFKYLNSTNKMSFSIPSNKVLINSDNSKSNENKIETTKSSYSLEATDSSTGNTGLPTLQTHEIFDVTSNLQTDVDSITAETSPMPDLGIESTNTPMFWPLFTYEAETTTESDTPKKWTPAESYFIRILDGIIYGYNNSNEISITDDHGTNPSIEVSNSNQEQYNDAYTETFSFDTTSSDNLKDETSTTEKNNYFFLTDNNDYSTPSLIVQNYSSTEPEVNTLTSESNTASLPLPVSHSNRPPYIVTSSERPVSFDNTSSDNLKDETSSITEHNNSSYTAYKNNYSTPSLIVQNYSSTEPEVNTLTSEKNIAGLPLPVSRSDRPQNIDTSAEKVFSFNTTPSDNLKDETSSKTKSNNSSYTSYKNNYSPPSLIVQNYLSTEPKVNTLTSESNMASSPLPVSGSERPPYIVTSSERSFSFATTSSDNLKDASSNYFLKYDNNYSTHPSIEPNHFTNFNLINIPHSTDSNEASFDYSSISVDNTNNAEEVLTSFLNNSQWLVTESANIIGNIDSNSQNYLGASYKVLNQTDYDILTTTTASPINFSATINTSQYIPRPSQTPVTSKHLLKQEPSSSSDIDLEPNETTDSRSDFNQVSTIKTFFDIKENIVGTDYHDTYLNSKILLNTLNMGRINDIYNSNEIMYTDDNDEVRTVTMPPINFYTSVNSYKNIPRPSQTQVTSKLLLKQEPTSSNDIDIELNETTDRSNFNQASAIKTSLDLAKNILNTDYHDTYLKSKVSMNMRGNNKTFNGNEIMYNRNNYIPTTIEYQIEESDEENVPNLRTKRSTRNWSCEALKIIGTSTEIILTENVIFKLNDNELFNCVDLFAKMDLPENVQNLIWSRINLKDIVLAGKLISACDLPNIENTNLSESHPFALEKIHLIGKYNKNMRVRKYIVNEVWTKAPRPFSTELVASLGSLICELPEIDSSVIEPNVLFKASVVLGKALPCNFTCLSKLSEIVIHPTAFGDPETWSFGDVNDLGVLISGLDLTTWKSLVLSNSAVLSGVTEDAFNCLPYGYIKIMNNVGVGYFRVPFSNRLLLKELLNYVHPDLFMLYTNDPIATSFAASLHSVLYNFVIIFCFVVNIILFV